MNAIKVELWCDGGTIITREFTYEQLRDNTPLHAEFRARMQEPPAFLTGLRKEWKNSQDALRFMAAVESGHEDAARAWLFWDQERAR